MCPHLRCRCQTLPSHMQLPCLSSVSSSSFRGSCPATHIQISSAICQLSVVRLCRRARTYGEGNAALETVSSGAAEGRRTGRTMPKKGAKLGVSSLSMVGGGRWRTARSSSVAGQVRCSGRGMCVMGVELWRLAGEAQSRRRRG